eukprot:12908705-Alexandrium_andersonii.AAC.1
MSPRCSASSSGRIFGPALEEGRTKDESTAGAKSSARESNYPPLMSTAWPENRMTGLRWLRRA